MTSTLLVVVCVLAIAVTGCDVADPMKGLSQTLKSERQG
jgi:hypothetical protein